MSLQPLTALSPLDGRYRNKIESLASYFSEFALMKYRVRVEVEYFIALAQLPLPQLSGFPEEKFESVRALYKEFSLQDAEAVKQIEATTNHDVKAVEYWLRKKWETLGISKYAEFIHFGLTSQDVNNTAIPLSIKDANTEVLIPALEKLHHSLNDKAKEWQKVVMLARTHGQPASPTSLGKEFGVFAKRLEKALDQLKGFELHGKFGGATGNFNAHFLAYPDTDWHKWAGKFLKNHLGLVRNYPTTQIDHYDDLSAYFDLIKRINTILTDLCQDAWLYISMEYFRQKTKEGEVGSSAMPHKVNPLDFENAEGNFGLSTAVAEFLSRKLPVSRLQRDLTDSTVLRNAGVPLGHTLLAVQSLQKGLDKLLLNEDKLRKDLEANWAVVAEGIQTILRREGYENPYEALRLFSRGKPQLTEKDFQEFIASLNINDDVKKELRNIRPENYTGRV